MTANAFADDVKRNKEAGMNDRISKLLDARKIISVLGNNIKPKVLLRFCSSTFGYYVCYFVTSFAKSPFSAVFPAKKLSALESVVVAIALSASAVRNA